MRQGRSQVQVGEHMRTMGRPIGGRGVASGGPTLMAIQSLQAARLYNSRVADSDKSKVGSTSGAMTKQRTAPSRGHGVSRHNIPVDLAGESL